MERCSPSLNKLKLDFSNKSYESDPYLPNFCIIAKRLTKVTLANINFTNKSGYVQFISFFSQLASLKDLELHNITFYEKLKGSLFN